MRIYSRWSALGRYIRTLLSAERAGHDASDGIYRLLPGGKHNRNSTVVHQQPLLYACESYTRDGSVGRMGVQLRRARQQFLPSFRGSVLGATTPGASDNTRELGVPLLWQYAVSW